MDTIWIHSQSDQYLLRTQNNAGAAVFPTLSALLYLKNKTAKQKKTKPTATTKIQTDEKTPFCSITYTFTSI